jgi:hypothetical protein
MYLPIAPYREQQQTWPREGRHILASFDAESIVVYQAYRPSIGRFAVSHGYLGGPDFSLARMSWIKPNFLWMMYRSGWGAKEGQEITLGLRLRRAFFDSLIRQAVASSYDPNAYPTREAWQAAVADSEVRRQWDPDHDPRGAKQDRRAIQLGLRGRVLEAMAKVELLEVIDMTEFVAEQRQKVQSGDLAGLVTPLERIYAPVLAGE